MICRRLHSSAFTIPAAARLQKRWENIWQQMYLRAILPERKDHINQDAVRLMKERFQIDMEAGGQHSKLLSDIPPVDVVITMGCNVQCPFLPCSHREDWGLEDPTGKSDEAFLETIRLIAQKVLELKARLS